MKTSRRLFLGGWLIATVLLGACGAIDLGSHHKGEPGNDGAPPDEREADAVPLADASEEDSKRGEDGSVEAGLTYLKASNTRSGARFGEMAIDGDTVAVGAWGDSSAATGIGGDGSNTSAPNAGAVYVFRRTGGTWKQEAYVKASNARSESFFGIAVALSADTLTVGSHYESSKATGVNGDEADTSAPRAGAVYVFRRTGTTWAQEAYLKASNTRQGATFGANVSLRGNVLIVGSPGESSSATGVSGNQNDTGAPGAGAAYVFTRVGATWSQTAYLKASNTRAGASFGASTAVDGTTIAIGAFGEASAARGINGNQNDTSAPGAGAAYVFTKAGSTWTQEAYIKASNTVADPNLTAQFGLDLTLFGDTLAVGCPIEPSNATGVDGNANDTSLRNAGAVYVFRRKDAAWSQEAYLKPSNTQSLALFGYSVALSGGTLVVGSRKEASGARGEGGDPTDRSMPGSGAAYVFTRTGGTWSQTRYLKATNTRADAVFGHSVAYSGSSIAVGSMFESSGATGIDGEAEDTSAPLAGAAYLFP